MCQTLCCQYYRARLGDVQSRIGLHRNWIPPTDSCGENLKKRSFVWVGQRVFLMFFSLCCVLQHLKWKHCVNANDRHFIIQMIFFQMYRYTTRTVTQVQLVLWVCRYCSHSGAYEILEVHYESWTLWSNEGAAEGSLALKAFSFNCLSPLPRPHLSSTSTSSLNPMCAAAEAKSG